MYCNVKFLVLLFQRLMFVLALGQRVGLMLGIIITFPKDPALIHDIFVLHGNVEKLLSL